MDAVRCKEWELMTLLEEEGSMDGVHGLGLLDVVDDVVGPMGPNAWTSPTYLAFVRFFLRRAMLLDYSTMSSIDRDRVVTVARAVVRGDGSPVDVVRHSTQLLLRVGHRSARFVVRALGTDLFTLSELLLRALGVLHAMCMELSGLQSLHLRMHEPLGDIRIADVLNKTLVAADPLLRFGAAKVLSVILLDTPHAHAKSLLLVLVDACNEEVHGATQASLFALLWDILFLRQDLFSLDVWDDMATTAMEQVHLLPTTVHAIMRLVLAPSTPASLDWRLVSQLLECVVVLYVHESATLGKEVLAALYAFFTDECGRTEYQQALVGQTLLRRNHHAYANGMELPCAHDPSTASLSQMLATRPEVVLKRENQLLQAMLTPDTKTSVVIAFQRMMQTAFYSSYSVDRVRVLLAFD
ncbi:hypothetical protein SDRG_13932 [Saprolegnia diclina VS20]|uniref:Uncharacterized protein n=1 Tax=Saprolegnia diclina (strain VS20) TaxID=1156394 RepID=T0Q4N2_SAPDV|nr:hypothetical protein SDRG_13932 [Saprolegnia diclina VS20]EQC28385.1 hypothetical protein SDRG_13932 [Saprolegnia diclina VS20]|eukprot:XP_008618255.1 hypothetical protein SDRG_13932 [Saprolegnia diclina VS20]